MYEVSEKMIGEIKKVIVGKEQVIRKIWIAILAQGHVLLEDVPGVGKTTMALSFAKALGLEVKRVQFTPDTMPSDITGFSVFHDGTLQYQAGAVMTNLLLADEINRTSPKTQSALLEAMEEGRVTVDGRTHALPSPFVVLATQNPVGSAGTQNLPNSQLDRFLMRLSMGYPDRAEQVDILKNRHGGDPLDAVQTVMTQETLAEAIGVAEKTFVSDAVYDYIAALTEATRVHPMIQLGVSPRGALSLCRAAKACAFTEGRDFVLPEDVREMVKSVFAHRLLLSSKARLNDCTAEEILDGILREIPVPQLTERRR
ncbi:MAG: AAA family ATPase [Faecousia sp.]